MQKRNTAEVIERVQQRVSASCIQLDWLISLPRTASSRTRHQRPTAHVMWDAQRVVRCGSRSQPRRAHFDLEDVVVAEDRADHVAGVSGGATAPKILCAALTS